MVSVDLSLNITHDFAIHFFFQVQRNKTNLMYCPSALKTAHYIIMCYFTRVLPMIYDSCRSVLLLLWGIHTDSRLAC